MAEAIKVQQVGSFVEGSVTAQRSNTETLNKASTLGRVLETPPGKYHIDGQWTLPKDVILNACGTELCIPSDYESDRFPDNAVVFAGGSAPALLGTSGVELREHDQQLPNVGQAAGDHLVLWNPADFSWSIDKFTYRQGEFVRTDTEGHSITGFYDTYPETTRIYRRQERTASISGLTVRGAGVADGSILAPLRYEWLTSGLIRDVKLYDSHYALAVMQHCQGVVVHNLNGSSIFPDSANNGLNYGLVMSHCQDCSISQSDITSLRHAFTTGGGIDEAAIINRNLSYDQITARSTGNISGFDWHGNADSCRVTNSHVYNGMTLQGMRHFVDRNTIRSGDRENSSIALYITRLKSPNWQVTNNIIQAKIRGGPGGSATNGVVLVLVDDRMVLPGVFRYEGNTLEAIGPQGGRQGLRIIVATQPPINPHYSIRRNVFQSDVAGQGTYIDRLPDDTLVRVDNDYAGTSHFETGSGGTTVDELNRFTT